MKLAVLLLVVGAFAPLQAAPTRAQAPARWRVEIERDDGELVCSLRADQDPLLDILEELARQAEISLDGVQGIWRRTLVSADLRRRPLRQALSFLLGSVGLRGELRQGALYLREGVEDSAGVDELLESALASYLRVLRDFPDHSLADDAVRRQAQIEVARGRPAVARANYESLVERYPESEWVAEAMFRSGELLVREEAWHEAAQRLSDLLRLESSHDFEAQARLELARCTAELGAHERALYMLDALEGIAAPRDIDDARRRAFVRVQALAGLGQGARALALLDDVDRRLGFAATRAESLALRAKATESAGLVDEAARAWLSYGRIAQGKQRAEAYARAARLALDGGDELSALFVTELAKREGIALGVDDVAREARQRLSLDENEASSGTALQRLARAERLLSADLKPEALRTLHAIAPLAPQLASPDRMRFVKVYARALHAELGIEAALSCLRAEVGALEDPHARRELYVLAAELLEHDGRLADAIEAYRGRL